VIVGIIRRKPVLTYASIIFGNMLASVNSVKCFRARLGADCSTLQDLFLSPSLPCSLCPSSVPTFFLPYKLTYLTLPLFLSKCIPPSRLLLTALGVSRMLCWFCSGSAMLTVSSFNKSSAVAEMGDRGHNRHGSKRGGC